MRELETAFQRWQGMCAYCGAKVQMQPPKQLKPIKATRDHFIPRSHGGGDGPGNVVLACHSCNTQKGGLDPRSILKVWLQIDPTGLADEIARLLETTQPPARTHDAAPPPFVSTPAKAPPENSGGSATREPPH